MEKDMTRNRNPTAPPGDIAMDPKARQDPQAQPISDREKALVRRAYALFDHFYEQLRADHEEMLEARRMRRLRQAQMSQTAPPSNTLNSCIDNAIADQVDNMPEARMVPEREETARSAEELTDVVSYVLYHAGWPGQYQKIMEDAVVTGTGVAQVYWDDELEDGEGMVSVTMWHPEDFYPDPRVENLQEGRGCFKATRTTIAWVEEHYPDARGYVGPDDYAGDREVSPEAPDGDAETTLLEFWYKRYDAAKKKTRVHMALLAGRALLFSSETGFGAAREDEYSDGVYAHGQYPFTVFKYRDVFRSPFGTGLVHDYKETQHAIDRCLKYIDDNARESSCNKYFIRRGSGINTEDIADRSRQIVEWDGNDIREVLQTVQAQPLNGQVYQIMQYMVDTMKQDSGQNQFSRGEGGLGVTALGALRVHDAGAQAAHRGRLGQHGEHAGPLHRAERAKGRGRRPAQARVQRARAGAEEQPAPESGAQRVCAAGDAGVRTVRPAASAGGGGAPDARRAQQDVDHQGHPGERDDAR